MLGRVRHALQSGPAVVVRKKGSTGKMAMIAAPDGFFAAGLSAKG
jgi:hypothetical protein